MIRFTAFMNSQVGPNQPIKRATIVFGNQGAKRAEAQWEQMFYVCTSRGMDASSITFDNSIVEADLKQIASTSRWAMIRAEIKRISSSAAASRAADHAVNIGGRESLVDSLQWLHNRVRTRVLTRVDLDGDSINTMQSCLVQWEESLRVYLATRNGAPFQTATMEASQEAMELANSILNE